MKPLLIFAVLLASLAPAAAATGGKWYLRYGTDNGPEALVFKSKAACEAGIRELKRRDAGMQKIIAAMGEKEFKRMNPHRSKSHYHNPRCLSRLPHGFLPPRCDA